MRKKNLLVGHEPFGNASSTALLFFGTRSEWPNFKINLRLIPVLQKASLRGSIDQLAAVMMSHSMPVVLPHHDATGANI